MNFIRFFNHKSVPHTESRLEVMMERLYSNWQAVGETYRAACATDGLDAESTSNLHVTYETCIEIFLNAETQLKVHASSLDKINSLKIAADLEPSPTGALLAQKNSTALQNGQGSSPSTMSPPATGPFTTSQPAQASAPPKTSNFVAADTFSPSSQAHSDTVHLYGDDIPAQTTCRIEQDVQPLSTGVSSGDIQEPLYEPHTVWEKEEVPNHPPPLPEEKYCETQKAPAPSTSSTPHSAASPSPMSQLVQLSMPTKTASFVAPAFPSTSRARARAVSLDAFKPFSMRVSSGDFQDPHYEPHTVWEREKVPNHHPTLPEEKYCAALYGTTIYRDEDGTIRSNAIAAYPSCRLNAHTATYAAMNHAKPFDPGGDARCSCCAMVV